MSAAITPVTSERPERDERRARILADVRAGLSRVPRELPSKYFYDERGSELFEEITELPEYYLTRAEREILVAQMPRLMRELRPRTLVELGAGSASKTRIILDAMRAAGALDTYVPVDVSAEFLAATSARLRHDYSSLRVAPMVADIESRLTVDIDVRRPMLVAFLGSTIGNFDEAGATALLRNIADMLGPFDRLLLGVDLRKDVDVIERAYNDDAGVTAAFNRNILYALNEALGASFCAESYDHRAFYERTRHRIEMHLVARRDQRVHIDGMHDVVIRAGESIRTEISCKYDRAAIDGLFAGAGLEVEQWLTDSQQRFALTLARTVRERAP